MKKLQRKLSFFLDGRTVLLAFILCNAVYLAMLLVSIPTTMSFAGDMKLPDMMPTGYDWNYIRDLLGALGPEGRNYYLTRQLLLDTFYPFLFAWSYATLFLYLLGKAGRAGSSWKFVALLPVIAAVSDYIENGFIVSFLRSYPNVMDERVELSSFFTRVKSISTAIYFIALLLLIVRFLLRRRKAKKT